MATEAQPAARHGQLPLYVLIRLLQDESEMVQLQMRLMSDGQLFRYLRRKYVDINNHLWRLWEQYAAGSYSVSRLLRAACRLQFPNWMAERDK